MPSALTPADYWLAQALPNLATSAEALAAVSAVLSLRSSHQRAHVEVERALRRVVETLGLTEVIESLGGDDLDALAGLARARVSYAAALSSDPAQPPAWRPRDPATMLGQGFASQEVAEVLHVVVLPQLTGLSDRLAQPGGSLLDVGVGVGGLALTLCRLYPRLSAVGIDVWQPALDIAGQRAGDAAFGDRFTLRAQSVAELDDHDAYDLGWLPVNFIRRELVRESLRRMRVATRAGGWIVLGMFGGPTELAIALAQLRAARIGGTFLRPAEAEGLLRDSGWTDIRSLPPALIGSLWLTAGRHPAP